MTAPHCERHWVIGVCLRCAAEQALAALEGVLRLVGDGLLVPDVTPREHVPFPATTLAAAMMRAERALAAVREDLAHKDSDPPGAQS